LYLQILFEVYSSLCIDFYHKYPNKTIFKIFTATLQAWRETRPLKKEFLRLIDSVKYAPITFQEYIDNALDLRITVIGEEVFAGVAKSKESYEFDWRTHMENIKWSTFNLPDDIKILLIKYVKELGLEYRAIDMKLRNDEYYFLEINPAGQYLFIENDTYI
jgi:glutathione synthase/RimK-type ligase-like ATP-grasp enzyme